MKKTLFTLAAALFAALAPAQENPVAPLQYDMTFKSRGEATSVQRVTVENLTRGTALELSGSDVLRLTNTPTNVGVENLSVPNVHSIIYPNPSLGAASLVFANRAAGNVQIIINDLGGRTMASSAFNLETGKHTAVLPAMPTGNYIVTIQGNGIKESIKWISAGNGYGGAISLNGFDSNVETTHAMSLPKPQPQFRAYADNKADNITEMLYAEGELLRFTGKNGNMTTIVMNIPTLSHDITFDFYDCTDANGYHYPIVNAGGMLWMAEDLRNVPTTVVPVRTSVSAWAGYSTGQPKQAYYGFSASNAALGGYYNYAGAKAALPEGWNLPTAGEIDYMFNKLGGYNRAANLLKARGDVWAQQQNVPDTVSFEATAMGELNPDGTFSGEDFRVKYWTRSTKGSIPIFWGIENSQALLDKDITADADYGFRVRGCRPAPSAYTDVADRFNFGSGLRASIFSDGPLGGMYTLSLEKQNLWQSFNAPNAANPVMKYKDYHDNTMKNSTAKAPLAANTGYTNQLQKAAAVNNSNGTQNLAVALWSRGSGLTSNGIEGDGYVSIVIFGDSAQGYAKIDSIRLPTQYNLPPYSGFNRLINKYTLNYGTDGTFINSLNGSAADKVVADFLSQSLGLETGEGSYAMNTGGSLLELLNAHKWYASRMQLLSGDFNADGVGDFALMVGNRIDVYSGVSPYPILYSKTFTSNNLRMAVGDVDGDLNPDIAVIYPSGTDNAQVEVFSSGNLNAAASSFITVPVGNNNDIKIGNIKPGGKNSIITITRKDNVRDCDLRVIDYNAGSLGNLATLSSANTAVVTNYQSATAYGCDNDNITLCRFRGNTYPADIVTQGSVYRFNDNGSNTLATVNSTINYGTYMSNLLCDFYTSSAPGNYSFFYTVLADNIVAGNFNNDESGKETIECYRSRVAYNNNYGATVGSATAGNPFNITNAWIEYTETQTPVSLYWNTSGSGSLTLNPLTSQAQANSSTFRINFSAVAHMGAVFTNYVYLRSLSITGVSNSTYNYPIYASARSTEPGKGLKYTGHTTSMSEPRIYALLAAPPFYAFKPDGTPYEYGAFSSMGTSWGKSQVTGSGTSNESSAKSSAIFGFEQEFNAPIIGTKLGSIDFTVKLESEWTSSTETNTVTTQSIEFTAPQNDAVILSASFFDTYTYEVVSSGNPDEIGSMLNISLPSQNRTLGLNLDDYNRLAADNPECPNLKQIFKHKVGFPFTYPNDKSQIQSNVAGSTVLWAMPFGGNEFVTVGSGVDVNRSITLDTETTASAGFKFGMEMELVATMMGVKAGAGFGYSNTNTSSHTEGEGHSIAGNVSGLRTIGEAGLGNFQWTIGWYKYRLGGQEFPVVQYVVKE